MTPPLVYVLILNWCSAEDTIACVQSVQELDYSNYKILIIDNGSNDDSETILKEKFPGLDFVQTNKNLGYAAGNNIGIRYAMKRGADFVWILNPDVRVDKESLKHLLEVMHKDASVEICGPRIKEGFSGKYSYVDGASSYPKKGYEFCHNSVSENNSHESSETSPVDYVIGCSMFIRGTVFEKIGLLREDFFLYGEETEFNFRVKKYGGKVLICKKALNQHLRDQSIKFKNDTHFYYGKRNRLILARTQGEYIFTTALKTLDFKAMRAELKQQYWRTSCVRIYKFHLKPTLMGLLKPLQKVPRL